MGVKSIILAEDRGEDMKSSKDKVLHSILGQPLINYPLEALRQAGLSDLCLIGMEYNEDVAEALGQRAQYIFEGEKSRITQIIDFIGNSGEIVVLNGDAPLITSIALQEAMAYHRQANKAITIVKGDCQEVGEQIYIFKAQALQAKLLQAQEDQYQAGSYFATMIKEILEDECDLASMVISHVSSLLRVHSRKQLAQSTSLMKNRINEKHMENGVTLEDPGNTYIEAGVKIGRDTIIEPNCILKGQTIIGNDCFIGHNSNIQDTSISNGVWIENSEIRASVIHDQAHIGPFAYIRPQSIIGKGAKIGDFVEIKNSTIGDGTKISHLTYVGDADVGKCVNFGCGSILVNYDGVAKHRSIIGDHAFIGCNTKIVSPVHIGEGAYTAAGSTITKDLARESLGIARSRQKNIEGWVARKFPKQ